MFLYRQILSLLMNDALRNALPECIRLYNNLTGKKRKKVADHVVTLGLSY